MKKEKEVPGKIYRWVGYDGHIYYGWLSTTEPRTGVCNTPMGDAGKIGEVIKDTRRREMERKLRKVYRAMIRNSSDESR